MNKPKNITTAAKALKRQGPRTTYSVTLRWDVKWNVDAVDEEHANEIAIEHWKEGSMKYLSSDNKPKIIKTSKPKQT